MSTQGHSSRRYRPLSRHYQRLFGCKVYKISVSVAQGCPNRQGRQGMSVCTFCDEWGSAAYAETAGLPLSEQIRVNRERIRRRYKAEKFLVYFQAYSNTFDRVAQLQHWYTEALRARDVVGVVIATRPDCLPQPVVRLLAGLARSTYVSVELGLQTLDDAQLAFLSRGHDSACSLRALDKLRACPEIEVCAHLMFGLPGETEGQLRRTAELLSAYGIQGVKLHNLHVLKNTPLQRLYEAGEFQPIGLEAYARRVRLFLEHLSPQLAVHRLNAVAPRWEQLVAPAWAREKMRPTQFILDELERADSWQGKHYRPSSVAAAHRPLEPLSVTSGAQPWA